MCGTYSKLYVTEKYFEFLFLFKNSVFMKRVTAFPKPELASVVRGVVSTRLIQHLLCSQDVTVKSTNAVVQR